MAKSSQGSRFASLNMQRMDVQMRRWFSRFPRKECIRCYDDVIDFLERFLGGSFCENVSLVLRLLKIFQSVYCFFVFRSILTELILKFPRSTNTYLPPCRSFLSDTNASVKAAFFKYLYIIYNLSNLTSMFSTRNENTNMENDNRDAFHGNNFFVKLTSIFIFSKSIFLRRKSLLTKLLLLLLLIFSRRISY